MIAIIKTGGKQYKVQKGDILSVERLPSGPKKRFLFDKVLLIADDKETLIGTPFLEKAAVRAEVIEDFKDDKVIVFKKKRRKQYRRTRGHRQPLTRVRILEIAADAASLSTEEAAEPEPPKAEAPPAKAEKAKPAAPKKPEKKETKPEKKAAPAKPEKAKKPSRPKRETPGKASSKKKKK
jgi:large subunit ribosomal protein L21